MFNVERFPPTLKLRNLTIAIVCAWLAPGSQSHAWTPGEFEVYCGLPKYYSVDISAAAKVEHVANRQTGNYSFDDYPYYEDEFGSDPDAAGPPNCANRPALIEAFAAEQLQIYRNMGFASPQVARLGPVIEGEGGAPQIRLFVADKSTFNSDELEALKLPSFANTLNPCISGSAVSPSRVAFVTLSAEAANQTPREVLYWLLAHEMGHVVQYAQPYYNVSGRQKCLAPLWLDHGSAEAIAIDMMKKQVGDYRPPIEVRYAKSRYGLRSYARAFRWVDNQALPHYRISSFWRHIIEHFHADDYSTLASWYGKTVLADNWLGWLDSNLQRTGKERLDFAYANFVAEYALWGKQRYKRVGDKAWNDTAFNGCVDVMLSPKTTKTLNLPFEYISARCLNVSVTGLGPNDVANVQLMAYHDERDEVDILHLGRSIMSDKVLELGTDFNCLEANRKLRGKTPCLLWPVTGDVPQSDALSQAPSHVRAWHTQDQQTADGELSNRYILSRAPRNPNSNSNPYKKIDYLVHIGVKVTQLKTSEAPQGKKAKSNAGAVPNSEPLPLDGTGADAAGFSKGDVTAMLDSMNISIPDIDIDRKSGGLKVLYMTVQRAEARSEGGLALKPEARFMIILENPIRYGATGSYQAKLVSIPEGKTPDPMAIAVSWPEESTIDLAVEQFDFEALTVTLSGDYCWLYDINPETDVCRSIKTIEATITRPAGWAYAVNQEMINAETAGDELYKNAKLERLAAALAVPAEGDPEPPATPASRSEAATIDGCDCSCEAYQKVVLGSQRLQSSGVPPEDLKANVEELARCTPACGQQWAGCSLQ